MIVVFGYWINARGMNVNLKIRNGFTKIYGSDVVKCHKCGCVYAKRRLNQHGLEVYWENYSSRCHTVDESLNKQRAGMYQLDFSYIDKFMDKNESPMY